MTESRPDFRIIGVAFLALVVMMLSALAWPRGDFVLVVGRPGDTPAHILDIIDKAGGSFVAGSNYPWLAVAHSDAPGFTYRLFQSGALIVIDHALAAGCIERT